MPSTPSPDHTVIVNADGTFSPQWTWIRDGETVEWQFHEPTDSIIPAEWSGKFPAICSAFKPYDPSDPNEFTGPMPRLPSGIFTLSPDGEGTIIKTDTGENFTDAQGNPILDDLGVPIKEFDQADAAVGSEYLWPGGERYATMDWTWLNPNITGVFIRLRWNDIDLGSHLGPNQYNWEIMDREIEKAVANGKLYSLAFKAGAYGTPQWMFDEAITDAADLVKPLDFPGYIDDSISPQSVFLGSPTDPNYRKHYFALLEAAAEHIKEKNAWYRALAYIKPSGANTHSHENRLPDRDDTDWNIWAEEGNYTPHGLYEFYREQTALLAAAFPNKDMSYALISSGFPNVNDAGEYGGQSPPPIFGLPAGTEQTEQVLEQGRMEHGVRFVVQHNGLGPKPQYERFLFSTNTMLYKISLNNGTFPLGLETEFSDNGITFNGTISVIVDSVLPTVWVVMDQGDPKAIIKSVGFGPLLEIYSYPQAPCSHEGVHPAAGPFASPPSDCPNRWTLEAGEAGQVTGFQTQHSGKKVGTPKDLESTLQNALDNSDCIFVEIYESRFWEAEMQPNSILDPSASNRNIANWAEEFHKRRLGIPGQFPDGDSPDWTEIPTPFPLKHSHTFTRTIASNTETQLLYYIHGAKCGKEPNVNYGVIAILPST